MFYELPQVADIAKSAFTIQRARVYCGSPPSGVGAIPCSAVAQQRHKIIRNGVALVREESVSVGHRPQPLPDQSEDPTHAHLHDGQ